MAGRQPRGAWKVLGEIYRYLGTYGCVISELPDPLFMEQHSLQSRFSLGKLASIVNQCLQKGSPVPEAMV